MPISSTQGRLVVPIMITSDLESWQLDHCVKNSAFTLFAAPSCSESFPISRPSISSIIITDGALRAATANNALTILLAVSGRECSSKWTKERGTYFSPSPTYRDMIDDGEALNVVTPARDARTRVMKVFPVPGGPWRSIPSTFFTSFRYDGTGRSRGSSTAIFTSSKAISWPE